MGDEEMSKWAEDKGFLTVRKEVEIQRGKVKMNHADAKLKVSMWTWGYPHMQIDKDIETWVNVSICKHVGICVYVSSWACVLSSGHWEVLGAVTAQMVVSTWSTQILVSWDHAPLRTRTPLRKGERLWAWNLLLWQEVKVLKRMKGTWQKNTETWLDWARWPNLEWLK